MGLGGSKEKNEDGEEFEKRRMGMLTKLVYDAIRFHLSRYFHNFPKDFHHEGLIKHSLSFRSLTLRSDILQHMGFPLDNFDVEAKVLDMTWYIPLNATNILKWYWGGKKLPEGGVSELVTDSISVKVNEVRMRVQPRSSFQYGGETKVQDRVRAWLTSVEGAWKEHLSTLVNQWALEERDGFSSMLAELFLLRGTLNIKHIRFEYSDTTISAGKSHTVGIALQGLSVAGSKTSDSFLSESDMDHRTENDNAVVKSSSIDQSITDGANGINAGAAALPTIQRSSQQQSVFFESAFKEVNTDLVPSTDSSNTSAPPPSSVANEIVKDSGVYLKEGLAGDSMHSEVKFPRAEEKHLHSDSFVLNPLQNLSVEVREISVFVFTRDAVSAPFSQPENASTIRVSPCVPAHPLPSPSLELGRSSLAPAMRTLVFLQSVNFPPRPAPLTTVDLGDRLAFPVSLSADVALGSIFSPKITEKDLGIANSLLQAASTLQRKNSYRRFFPVPPQDWIEAAKNSFTDVVSDDPQSSTRLQKSAKSLSRSPMSHNAAAPDKPRARQLESSFHSEQPVSSPLHDSPLTSMPPAKRLLARAWWKYAICCVLFDLITAKKKALGTTLIDSMAGSSIEGESSVFHHSQTTEAYKISRYVLSITSRVRIPASKDDIFTCNKTGICDFESYKTMLMERKRLYISATIASWTHLSHHGLLVIPPLVYPPMAVICAPSSSLPSSFTPVSDSTQPLSLSGFSTLLSVRPHLAPARRVFFSDAPYLTTPEVASASSVFKGFSNRLIKEVRAGEDFDEASTKNAFGEALVGSGGRYLKVPILAPVGDLVRRKAVMCELKMSLRDFLQREGFVVGKNDWDNDNPVWRVDIGNAGGVGPGGIGGRGDGGSIHVGQLTGGVPLLDIQGVLDGLRLLRLIEVEGYLSREELLSARREAEAELCSRYILAAQGFRNKEACIAAQLLITPYSDSSSSDSSMQQRRFLNENAHFQRDVTPPPSADIPDPGFKESSATKFHSAWWLRGGAEALLKARGAAWEDTLDSRSLKVLKRKEKEKGGPNISTIGGVLSSNLGSLSEENHSSKPPTLDFSRWLGGFFSSPTPPPHSRHSSIKSSPSVTSKSIDALSIFCVPHFIGRAVALDLNFFSKDIDGRTRDERQKTLRYAVSRQAVETNMSTFGTPSTVAFLQQWILDVLSKRIFFNGDWVCETGKHDNVLVETLIKAVNFFVLGEYLPHTSSVSSTVAPVTPDVCGSETKYPSLLLATSDLNSLSAFESIVFGGNRNSLRCVGAPPGAIHESRISVSVEGLSFSISLDVNSGLSEKRLCFSTNPENGLSLVQDKYSGGVEDIAVVVGDLHVWLDSDVHEKVGIHDDHEYFVDSSSFVKSRLGGEKLETHLNVPPPQPIFLLSNHSTFRALSEYLENLPLQRASSTLFTQLYLWSAAAALSTYIFWSWRDVSPGTTAVSEATVAAPIFSNSGEGQRRSERTAVFVESPPISVKRREEVKKNMDDLRDSMNFALERLNQPGDILRGDSSETGFFAATSSIAKSALRYLEEQQVFERFLLPSTGIWCSVHGCLQKNCRVLKRSPVSCHTSNGTRQSQPLQNYLESPSVNPRPAMFSILFSGFNAKFHPRPFPVKTFRTPGGPRLLSKCKGEKISTGCLWWQESLPGAQWPADFVTSLRGTLLAKPGDLFPVTEKSENDKRSSQENNSLATGLDAEFIGSGSLALFFHPRIPSPPGMKNHTNPGVGDSANYHCCFQIDDACSALDSLLVGKDSIVPGVAKASIEIPSRPAWLLCPTVSLHAAQPHQYTQSSQNTAWSLNLNFATAEDGPTKISTVIRGISGGLWEIFSGDTVLTAWETLQKEFPGGHSDWETTPCDVGSASKKSFSEILVSQAFILFSSPEYRASSAADCEGERMCSLLSALKSTHVPSSISVSSNNLPVFYLFLAPTEKIKDDWVKSISKALEKRLLTLDIAPAISRKRGDTQSNSQLHPPKASAIKFFPPPPTNTIDIGPVLVTLDPLGLQLLQGFFSRATRRTDNELNSLEGLLGSSIASDSTYIEDVTVAGSRCAFFQAVKYSAELSSTVPSQKRELSLEAADEEQPQVFPVRGYCPDIIFRFPLFLSGEMAVPRKSPEVSSNRPPSSELYLAFRIKNISASTFSPSSILSNVTPKFVGPGPASSSRLYSSSLALEIEAFSALWEDASKSALISNSSLLADFKGLFFSRVSLGGGRIGSHGMSPISDKPLSSTGTWGTFSHANRSPAFWLPSSIAFFHASSLCVSPFSSPIATRMLLDVWGSSLEKQDKSPVLEKDASCGAPSFSNISRGSSFDEIPMAADDLVAVPSSILFLDVPRARFCTSGLSSDFDPSISNSKKDLPSASMEFSSIRSRVCTLSHALNANAFSAQLSLNSATLDFRDEHGSNLNSFPETFLELASTGPSDSLILTLSSNSNKNPIGSKIIERGWEGETSMHISLTKATCCLHPVLFKRISQCLQAFDKFTHSAFSKPAPPQPRDHPVVVSTGLIAESNKPPLFPPQPTSLSVGSRQSSSTQPSAWFPTIPAPPGFVVSHDLPTGGGDHTLAPPWSISPRSTLGHIPLEIEQLAGLETLLPQQCFSKLKECVGVAPSRHSKRANLSGFQTQSPHIPHQQQQQKQAPQETQGREEFSASSSDFSRYDDHTTALGKLRKILDGLRGSYCVEKTSLTLVTEIVCVNAFRFDRINAVTVQSEQKDASPEGMGRPFNSPPLFRFWLRQLSFSVLAPTPLRFKQSSPTHGSESTFVCSSPFLVSWDGFQLTGFDTAQTSSEMSETEDTPHSFAAISGNPPRIGADEFFGWTGYCDGGVITLRGGAGALLQHNARPPLPIEHVPHDSSPPNQTKTSENPSLTLNPPSLSVGVLHLLLDSFTCSAEPDPRGLPGYVTESFYDLNRKMGLLNSGRDGRLVKSCRWIPGASQNVHLVKDLITLSSVYTRRGLLSQNAFQRIPSNGVALAKKLAFMVDVPSLSQSLHTSSHPVSSKPLKRGFYHQHMQPHIGKPFFTPPAQAHAAYSSFPTPHPSFGEIQRSEAEAEPEKSWLPALWMEHYSTMSVDEPSFNEKSNASSVNAAFSSPTSFRHVSLGSFALTGDALCLLTATRFFDSLEGYVEGAKAVLTVGDLRCPPSKQEGEQVQQSVCSSEATLQQNNRKLKSPQNWDHTGIEMGAGVLNLCVLCTSTSNSFMEYANQPTSGVGGAQKTSGSSVSGLSGSPAAGFSSGLSMPLATIILGRVFLGHDKSSVPSLSVHQNFDTSFSERRSVESSLSPNPIHSQQALPATSMFFHAQGLCVLDASPSSQVLGVGARDIFAQWDANVEMEGWGESLTPLNSGSGNPPTEKNFNGPNDCRGISEFSLGSQSRRLYGRVSELVSLYWRLSALGRLGEEETFLRQFSQSTQQQGQDNCPCYPLFPPSFVDPNRPYRAIIMPKHSCIALTEGAWKMNTELEETGTSWSFSVAHSFLLLYVPARVILTTPWLTTLLFQYWCLFRVHSDYALPSPVLPTEKSTPSPLSADLKPTVSSDNGFRINGGFVEQYSQSLQAEVRDGAAKTPTHLESFKRTSILEMISRGMKTNRLRLGKAQVSNRIPQRSQSEKVGYEDEETPDEPSVVYRPHNMEPPMCYLSSTLPLGLGGSATKNSAVDTTFSSSSVSDPYHPDFQLRVLSPLLESARKGHHRDCLRTTGLDQPSHLQREPQTIFPAWEPSLGNRGSRPSPHLGSPPCPACVSASHMTCTIRDASVTFLKSFQDEVSRVAIPQVRLAGLYPSFGAAGIWTAGDVYRPPSFDKLIFIGRELKVFLPCSTTGAVVSNTLIERNDTQCDPPLNESPLSSLLEAAGMTRPQNAGVKIAENNVGAGMRKVSGIADVDVDTFLSPHTTPATLPCNPPSNLSPMPPPGSVLLISLPAILMWNSLVGCKREKDWETDTPMEATEMIVLGGIESPLLPHLLSSTNIISTPAALETSSRPICIALCLPQDFVRNCNSHGHTFSATHTRLCEGMSELPAWIRPDAPLHEFSYGASKKQDSTGLEGREGNKLASHHLLSSSSAVNPSALLGNILIEMKSVRVNMETPIAGSSLLRAPTQSFVECSVGLNDLNVRAPSIEQAEILNPLRKSNFAEPPVHSHIYHPPRPNVTSDLKMFTSANSNRTSFHSNFGDPNSGELVMRMWEKTLDPSTFPPLPSPCPIFVRTSDGFPSTVGGKASESAIKEVNASTVKSMDTNKSGLLNPQKSNLVLAPTLTFHGQRPSSQLLASKNVPQVMGLGTHSQMTAHCSSSFIAIAESASLNGLQALLPLLRNATRQAFTRPSSVQTPPVGAARDFDRRHKLQNLFHKMQTSSFQVSQAKGLVEDPAIVGVEGAATFFKSSVISLGLPSSLNAVKAALQSISESLNAALEPSNFSQLLQRQGVGGIQISSSNNPSHSAVMLATLLNSMEAKELLPVLTGIIGAISENLEDVLSNRRLRQTSQLEVANKSMQCGVPDISLFESVYGGVGEPSFYEHTPPSDVSPPNRSDPRETALIQPLLDKITDSAAIRPPLFIYSALHFFDALYALVGLIVGLVLLYRFGLAISN